MKSWMGLALSGLVIATLPGCSSTSKVASAGATAPSRPADPAKMLPLLLTSAQSAIARADALVAIRDAEAAVALAPQQADARALLGRAYLTAGRFQSAETAFGDALTLDPSLGNAAVTRALTQIALGDKDAALASLAQADGKGGEADIGLALALAGHVDDGVQRLETAARAKDATPRTRQNLAFAYALQGRWDVANATASVDLPPEQVTRRMQRWTQIAQHGAQPAIQVAMLLGVIPSADAGQPATLALAKPAAPVELAFTEVPPPADESETPAPVLAEAQTHIDLPAVAAQPMVPVALAMPAPAVPALLQVAAASPVQTPPLLIARRGVPRIGGAKILGAQALASAAIVPQRVALKAVAPKLATAKVPAAKAVLATQFVVQLGAFSTAQRSETAWNKMNGKVSYISAFRPVGSGLQRGNATLHRLALSGFANRDAAAQMCGRIKANGGDCFVRAASGDRPVQWVMRKGEREAA